MVGGLLRLLQGPGLPCGPALRPLCADDVPIVGQTLIPNLYVNSGHGSKGWSIGQVPHKSAQGINEEALTVTASGLEPRPHIFLAS